MNIQSNTELFATEKNQDEVTVVLVHKFLQQLHLLTLHFEIIGYLPGIMNGLEYLHRARDFRGDNFIRRHF